MIDEKYSKHILRMKVGIIGIFWKGVKFKSLLQNFKNSWFWKKFDSIYWNKRMLMGILHLQKIDKCFYFDFKSLLNYKTWSLNCNSNKSERWKKTSAIQIELKRLDTLGGDKKLRWQDLNLVIPSWHFWRNFNLVHYWHFPITHLPYLTMPKVF